MASCPCGNEAEYDVCCGPLIRGERHAKTAEALMRSRYTAYTLVEMDYIFQTTHPTQREHFDMKDSRKWAEESQWHSLEIVGTEAGGAEDSEGTVEFVANYTQNGKTFSHHELSTFKKIDGQWFFEDGQGVKPKQFVRELPKVKPNDPCPCGSGRKHKKCCLGKAAA